MMLGTDSRAPLATVEVVRLFCARNKFPGNIMGLIAYDHMRTSVLLASREMGTIAFMKAANINGRMCSGTTTRNGQIRTRYRTGGRTLMLRSYGLRTAIGTVVGSACKYTNVEYVTLPIMYMRSDVTSRFISLLGGGTRTVGLNYTCSRSASLNPIMGTNRGRGVYG